MMFDIERNKKQFNQLIASLRKRPFRTLIIIGVCSLSVIVYMFLEGLIGQYGKEIAKDPEKPVWWIYGEQSGYDQNTLERFQKILELQEWTLPNSYRKKHGKLMALHERSGLNFILVQGDTFNMGSPEIESGREGDEYKHPVTISSFLLSETECTQASWFKGILKTVKGPINKGMSHPIENISQEECKQWCKHMGLRLPSESEWEYSCRAGSLDKWCFGSEANLFEKYAWYVGNSKGKSKPVAGLLPNSWGFYDMHGNVAERCADAYNSYKITPIDGRPNEIVIDKSPTVTRGGDWNRIPNHCRSADRCTQNPEGRYSNLGFRPAASL